jgi:Ca2+-binding RTX toxin-like protein
LVQDGADTVLQVDRDGGDNSYIPFIRFENTMVGGLQAMNLDWYGLTGNDFPALSWVGTSGDDVLNSGVTGVMNASGMGGDDRIILSDGDDFGRGGDGNDVIYGGFGNDWLEGNLGNDELHGGEGRDLFIGSEGIGSSNGSGGVDRFYGGIGGDSYIVDTQAHLIFENAGEGRDDVRSSVSYYLYDNIEDLNLTGTSDIFGVGNVLDNSLFGNSGSNLLLGGLGDDEIRGFAGNDLLFGEGGSDTIYGGEGTDYLVGGAGRDNLIGDEGADAIYGGTGNDSLVGGTGFFTDILVGGDGDDILDGGFSTGALPQLGDYDLMDGGFGNDIYYVDTPADLTFEAAEQGNDTVHADIVGAGYYLYPHVENLVLMGATPFGVGNDLDNNLTGNAVGNYLLGGGGNDFINGGNGNDVLFGETGNDTFVFNRGAGTDIIGDFTRGQDRIILSEYGLSFAQLQARFVQVGNDGAIYLPNGDVIILHNIVMSQLTAADILAAPSSEVSPKTDADVMDIAHGFVAGEEAAELFANDVLVDDGGLQRWGIIRPEFELV